MRPDWLKKKIDLKDYDKMKERLAPFNVHTVCDEARCPNISECYAKDTATFLLLGDICTRNCSFCGVKKGKPEAVDVDEPRRIAAAVHELDLDYVVLTGVTRDDIFDGGAEYYAQTIEAIRKLDREEEVKIELLIPDFNGLRDNIAKVVEAKPYVIGHNVETVASLYPALGRDEYRYEVSLSTIETIKCVDEDMTTKSGIMLGLGETEIEVLKTFEDLIDVKCDYLSIGQYLAPSGSHYEVKEYIHPDKFKFWEEKAKEFGFKSVKSGPYVRSSYCAHEYTKDGK